MGHSIVEWRGRSARLHDLDLCATARLLLTVVRERVRAEGDSEALRAQMRAFETASDAPAPGMVELDMESCARNLDEVAELARTFDVAEEKARAFGERVPKGCLNEVEGAYGLVWQNDVDARVVIGAIVALRALIDQSPGAPR